MEKIEWHAYSVKETVKKLNSDLEQGLTDSAANQRVKKFGKNELEEKKGRNPIKIFFMQFTSTIVIVLLIAAVITGIIGEVKDTVVISSSFLSTH